MRNIFTAAVVLVALVAFTAVSNAETLARYDIATGSITFEDVTSLVGLRINSSDASLIGGQATDLDGAAAGSFGVVNDQAPNFYEWGNLLGMTFTSSVAGNIFPTGLVQSDLDTNYVFKYRTSAAPTVDVFGPIVGVPEPTTLGLAGLGLIGFVARRRR